MKSSATVELKLYVQGQSANSTAALDMVKRVCNSELHDAYNLEVIDIQNQPEQAIAAGIMAAPALVRCSPDPVLKTTGRLNEARIRIGLGLDGR